MGLVGTDLDRVVCGQKFPVCVVETIADDYMGFEDVGVGTGRSELEGADEGGVSTEFEGFSWTLQLREEGCGRFGEVLTEEGVVGV